ncbi:hypothetical protein IEO21_00068 [Rhodonia placenta]|uniref:Uncharacterized protein n=1 Tax=Rhodonia placenta TaxID=104341 RepID=A0A8H7U6G2_9APHY|nr:hypothetical protein IEO21_00068 [Postia placenta]
MDLPGSTPVGFLPPFCLHHSSVRERRLSSLRVPATASVLIALGPPGSQTPSQQFAVSKPDSGPPNCRAGPYRCALVVPVLSRKGRPSRHRPG